MEYRGRPLEFRVRIARKNRSRKIDRTADRRAVWLRGIVRVIWEGESPPGSAPS
jgi:hypothetical protein